MATYRDMEDALAQKVLVPREIGVEPRRDLVIAIAPRIKTSLDPESMNKTIPIYGLRYMLYDSSAFGWIYQFDGIVPV